MMTYTLDTTMLGPVDCSVAQIMAALEADSSPHVYPESTRREFAEWLVHWCDVFGLRSSAVAAQCLHETGRLRFGGQVQPSQLNFAGLGATNDGAAGATFANISDGVRAVCSHHMAYIYGPVDNVPAHLRTQLNSPRYSAVLSAGYGGVVRIIGDYTNGRWAWSPQYPRDTLDNGYARAIVRGANEIQGYPSGEVTTMTDIPGIPWVPADSRHYTRGRTVPWPDLLIQHHTDGVDSLAWLTTSPQSNVSATYLLWHNGTIRAQLVRHADTPHTTAAYNPRSISCEWERNWPEQSDISDSQYRNIGRFWAQVVEAERERGNPHFQGTPAREQLKGHKDFYPTTCPGNLDLDRVYIELVAALAAQPIPPPDIPACITSDGNTGHLICHGFKEHYEATTGILTLGFARSPDFEIDDARSPTGKRNVQVFDKGILIYLAEYPDGQTVQRLPMKAPLFSAAMQKAATDYGDWSA